MSLPRSTRYLVVGAGIHGLSTAYHLGKELPHARHWAPAPTSSSSRRPRPGAGASGIACGVVRNNYFQPAMQRADAGLRRGLGVRSRRPTPTTPSATWRSARRCRSPTSRPSTSASSGSATDSDARSSARPPVDAHMKELFPDWRAKGVTVCLHEHQGGFAFNLDSVPGIVGKCESEGVTIISGVEVTGFELGERRLGHARSRPSQGRIEVGEQLVVAPGPVGQALLGDARAAA